MTALRCATLCVIAVLLASGCGPAGRSASRPASRPGLAVAAAGPVAGTAIAPGTGAESGAGASTQDPSPTLAPVPIRDMTPERIRAEIWPEERASFVPMSAGERERLAALVAGLTAAARSGGDVRALAVRASEIGFRVELWRVRGRVFWALLEEHAQRRGAGAYLLRPGPHLGGGPEIVLQAPHVFFDRGTGHIATALFFGQEGRGRARALFANTVYRYDGMDEHAASAPAAGPASDPASDSASDSASAPGSAPAAGPADAPSGPVAAPERHAPADVAHAADHAFQAATEAIVRELGQVVVIQLHGFAERPTRPEIILSSGADEVGALLVELATGLGAVFERVLRYPDEFHELGATTNVQGRMLALHPAAHFIHVELSARTRRRLVTTPALLARFADAVLSLGR